MRRQEVIVEPGKCPLELLAEMGRQVESAWLFFHRDIVNHLWDTSDQYVQTNDGIELKWNGTSKKSINVKKRFHDYKNSSEPMTWYEVIEIEAVNIAFKRPAVNPDEIFFFSLRK